jgi:hypothetical protein
MLFDLGSGKRKQVVRLVYAFLAVIFLVGFVGFSIGSGGAPGGLLDALGLGSGSGSSSGNVSSQFDSQIAAAQKRVKADPKDQAALIRLSRYQYFKGQAELGVNNGQPVLTDSAHTDLGAAVDTWERYLKLVGAKANPNAAVLLVQAYVYLNDAAGAARTQEIVAKAQPSENSYGTLAFYLYIAGKIGPGDAAAKQAVAQAPKAQQAQVKKQLDQYRQQGIKLAKQQKQAAKAAQAGAATSGQNPLQSPFGGVAPPGG